MTRVPPTTPKTPATRRGPAAAARYRPKLSAQPHWPPPPLPSQPAASPGEPGRLPGAAQATLREQSELDTRGHTYLY